MMRITRTERKEKGRNREITYSAVVNGVEYKGYDIFRILYGITEEEGDGLLHEGGSAIRLRIGKDERNFMRLPLDTTSPSELQKGIRERMREVEEWLATLNYETSISIEV